MAVNSNSRKRMATPHRTMTRGERTNDGTTRERVYSQSVRTGLRRLRRNNQEVSRT